MFLPLVNQKQQAPVPGLTPRSSAILILLRRML